MSARQKRRTILAEQWIAYSREMIESPALRALSLIATRVMHRLEAEHMNHGGAENGRLLVTFDQLEQWGMDRNSIAPAIRELVALGFVEITEHGRGGAETGLPNRFRLTYVNSKTKEVPSNEWSRITTLAEAKRLASDARHDKNQRASDLGKRAAFSKAKKYFPVSKTPTGPVRETLTETPISQSGKPLLLAPVRETLTTIYNLGGYPLQPDAAVRDAIAALPYSPPRRATGNIRPRHSSGLPVPIDALVEFEGRLLSNDLSVVLQ
jgi:hypothetical protein